MYPKVSNIIFTLITVTFLQGHLLAADDEKTEWPTSFECRYATTAPKIDGRPNDPAWKSAQLIDSFYLPWLQDKARASKTTTKARLLWDRHNLYFLAELEDADLFADITEHDGRTWHNDVFELFFKPAEKKPAYYEFQINAAGTVMDMHIPKRTRDLFTKYIAADEFHVESKVALRGKLNDAKGKDKGWTVEGRIPWRDFQKTGGRPAAGDQWKFALCRYDYSNEGDKPELSTNAPLKTQKGPDFHAHEDYATLKFVGPAPIGVVRPDAGNKPRARLEALQREFGRVTSTVVGSPDPPPPFRVQRVLPKIKLTNPVTVVNEPGSRRLLIIEQSAAEGASRLYHTTDTPKDGKLETLLDFPKSSIAFNIAFHPAVCEERLHLHRLERPARSAAESENWTGPHKDKHTIVTRYTLDRKPPYKLDPKSALEIISWPSNGHNGAAVAFGHDGMLYVTAGDGTSDSDTDVTGQGMSHLLSKLMRIDVEHPADGRQYSVPKDNPFVGQEGIRPETWAYGFRNPWRMTVDEKTGDIWVGNNGQDLWEQAYVVQRGANYGWSVYEGGHIFYPTRKLGPTPHVKPTVEHSHAEARSLTGGVVYYGNKFPELRGVYIYGDHSTGKIWGARVEKGKLVWNKELADTTLHISDFALDADGELLVLDYQNKELGGLYEFVRTPPDSGNKNFPRKLSQSGLFASVAEHRVQPGVIPYSVNAALWSDGAYKERALYVPETTGTGDEEKPTTISVRGNRGWNLPDGTVAIKSFALDMTEGDPNSRRWIETRFLTRHEGEWVGYTYLWNDEQTDATLVEAKGADHKFTIKTADGGTRELAWRYPSRNGMHDLPQPRLKISPRTLLSPDE